MVLGTGAEGQEQGSGCVGRGIEHSDAAPGEAVAVIDEEFLAHLNRASAIVATWPKWKQNLLEDSSKPFCDVPRTPVDNSQVVRRVYGGGEMAECGGFDDNGLWRDSSGRASVCVDGVGKDAPVVVNAAGGKQSSVRQRLDLMPPLALLAVGEVLSEGAAKYGDNNWHSIPVNDHLNHALIHAYAFLAGDRQDDHLEHFACRAMMALEIALRERKGIKA